MTTVKTFFESVLFKRAKYCTLLVSQQQSVNKNMKNGWHHRLLLCNLTLTHAIQNNIQLWLKYNLDIRVYQVCAMHAFRRDDAHVETGLESCRCWMHPHCAWKNHLLHWFVNCLLFVDKFQILTYTFKQLL